MLNKGTATHNSDELAEWIESKGGSFNVNVDDDYTVSANEGGMTFGIATDAKTITLPSTEAGLIYQFVNTGADGSEGDEFFEL